LADGCGERGCQFDFCAGRNIQPSDIQIDFLDLQLCRRADRAVYEINAPVDDFKPGH
jgi:hypothetical protein